jgi:spoIIIJ-associated protein
MEFEARSIEKALKKASETLNLSEQDLKYEIISYGSTGIFGLVGAKRARIRVAAPGSEDDDSKKEIKNSGLSEKEAVSGTQLESETEPEDQGKAIPADIDQPDVRALGRDVLQKILDAITSDAHIVDTTESSDGETLVFKVKGGNAAVLIGKKGQTLDAIQYLVEKIVNRHSENRLRLQVDVEGYLENRKTNLENLAFRLAQKAKKIGKPMTIGQLKPQERRVVHLALKDNPDVRTQSVGDGFVRKLVIIPRKKQETS